MAQPALLLLLPTLLLAACVEDEDVDNGPEGLPTDNGLYLLDLVMNPDPPTAGPAALDIVLSDADGAPVSGATITVVPWMPEHDHGVMGDVLVTDAGQGACAASWDYPMSGTWELTIEVEGAPGSDGLEVDVDVQ